MTRSAADKTCCDAYLSIPVGSTHLRSRCCRPAQDGAAASSASLATEKFAAALKVKQAAQAGRFDEVEAELRQLDDNFTDNHPKVLLGILK